MTGRLVALAAVMGSLFAAATADLSACGDKFLRIGRSPRHKYAAVHTASILLYVPSAKPSNVKEWEKALKSAGHRPSVVRDVGAFARAVADGKYDIVITSLAEATRLRHITASAPAMPMPTLLPIVSRTSKQASSEIAREFAHHLDDGANRIEVYMEIDRVMELRLADVP